MQDAYAQALWKIVEGGATPKSAVKAVHEALLARGRLGLLPRISRAFLRLSLRSLSRDAIVLYVARETDAKRAHREVKPILSEAGIKAEEVKICIDESLVGGWRLEGRELLRDASYKRQLLDIYERVLEK